MVHCKSEAILYCKDILDGCEEVVLQTEDHMSELVRDLLCQWQENKAVAAKSEATFTEKYLMMFIRKILLKRATEDMLFALIDKPEAGKKKPDFMLGTSKARKEYYFFYIEVKQPGAKSCYQAKDDYTKLMKLMKHAINKQLELGVMDPSSMGLLVEGFHCTLYNMTLVAEGIYVPGEVTSFRLLEKKYDIMCIPTIVESFMLVKSGKCKKSKKK